MESGAPLFRAVASSTRQLFQLLKCINFTSKVHVQITEDGIRLSADHHRIMQGSAFLDKALFTSFALNLPASENEDEEPPLPNFQISLPALLETLQIFGAADHAARLAKQDVDPYRSNIRNYRSNAFSHQTLGMPGTCIITYAEEGAPFGVIMDEAGVKTTCNLVTYLPDSPEDIPFDRENLAFKIIAQARWLHEALSELAPTGPEKLKMVATKEAPFLNLSGVGHLGSTAVDFARGRDLFETFSIEDEWVQSFKFDMIKSTTDAMKIASKVSIRGDIQGVLSLQFMVPAEGGGVSYLTFLFVPYVSHDDDDEAGG